MRTTFDLSGKTYLVTGASSGIGRATAQMIAELGGTVVLTARRETELKATLSSLVGNGPHRLIAGDLTDEAFLERLVAQAGPLDGLVHAAGVCTAVPIATTTPDDLTDSLAVNYLAFMRLMKAYAKRKNVREGFSAVAIASVSAQAGWAGGSLYAGSKGALLAAIRALAIELAPRARVNAVLPSHIRTPLFAELAEDLNDEAAQARLLARQPLGLGEPRQVAGPVCFLLSEAASFVTGVALPVDGGYLAQ